MKLIYIPIEVKTRELITKLFFIANNIDENFIFFIGDKMATKNATSSLAKGIYFYKSINWYDTPHINRIKNKGNVYISLDEEGGVTQSNKSNFLSILNRRSSELNVSLTDKIFTWGDFDFNGWRDKYKKYKNKIVKTGSPRFDLWRKEVYSKIFKDEILYLKKYAPYIFIPSTFINSYDWLKKEIKHEKKMNKGNSKEPSSFLKKRIKQSKDSYKSYLAYVEMIKKLSVKFPKKKIIIKPHPKENIMDWKKKLDIKDKHSNIIINNEFDLTAYIAAAESVIFTETIAGMQSAIMGKKTISYNIKNVKTLRDYANKCVPNTTDFKTLIKYLNKKSKFKNYKYNKKLRERFYIANKTSSKIIMENIKKIKSENINIKIFYFKLKIYNIFYLFLDNLRFLFINLKNKIFDKSNFKSYSVKMPGGIKKEEIEKIFKSLGLIKKVKIIRFGKNGFIIHRNLLRN
jgi:surface carbohydrate biosynthesis protein